MCCAYKTTKLSLLGSGSTSAATMIPHSLGTGTQHAQYVSGQAALDVLYMANISHLSVTTIRNLVDYSWVMKR